MHGPTRPHAAGTGPGGPNLLAMSKRRLLCLASSLILLVQGTAHSAPADASTPPRTSGPVVGAAIPCEDNGPAGRNEAKGQACSWSYQLLPVDTSASEDFRVYWIQMEIDPGKGMCAHELSFGMTQPEPGAIVSAMPDKDRRIDSYTEEVATFSVDAAGTAPVPAVLEQDVALGKGRISVELDENSYSFRWRGNSKKKVMFAIGVELSNDSGPPDLFYTWEESQGGAMGSCRPLSVQVGLRP